MNKGKTIGFRDGKTIGIQEGKILGMLEAMQEMIVDDLTEKFDVVPVHISERIRKIRNTDVLKGIRRRALKCQNMAELENLLNRV